MITLNGILISPWSSMRVPWKSMEVPWNFMNLHRIWMKFHRIPWSSMDRPWNSMEFHGSPMGFHKFSMKFHWTPWSSMKVHGVPWSSMEFHGIPWNSMGLFYTGKGPSKNWKRDLRLKLSYRRWHTDWLKGNYRYQKRCRTREKWRSSNYIILQNAEVKGYLTFRFLFDSKTRL